MNGRKIVLDTNILIYYSKGLIDLGGILSKYDEWIVSVITEIEFLGYPFRTHEEEELAKSILSQFSIVQTDPNISTLTVSLRKTNKIKLPDAIILSTAIHFSADLLTNNRKDFDNKGIKIVSMDIPA